MNVHYVKTSVFDNYSKANVKKINKSLDNYFVVFETLTKQMNINEL